MCVRESKEKAQARALTLLQPDSAAALSQTAHFSSPVFAQAVPSARNFLLFPLCLSNPAGSGFDSVPPDLTACRWSFGDPCLPLWRVLLRLAPVSSGTA